MSQQRKKPSLDTEPVADEAKAHALRQYNDTDGHFSLVRFVHATLTRRGLRPLLTRIGLEQEFPPRRPRNNHERRLRRILHLLFSQVSRDKRHRLSLDRSLAPTRRVYVRFVRRKDCAVEEGEQHVGSGVGQSRRPSAHILP